MSLAKYNKFFLQQDMTCFNSRKIEDSIDYIK